MGNPINQPQKKCELLGKSTSFHPLSCCHNNLRQPLRKPARFFRSTWRRPSWDSPLLTESKIMSCYSYMFFPTACHPSISIWKPSKSNKIPKQKTSSLRGYHQSPHQGGLGSTKVDPGLESKACEKHHPLRFPGGLDIFSICLNQQPSPWGKTHEVN